MTDDSLDNVIRFPVEAVSKLGFERAQRPCNARRQRMEDAGQMNMFDGAETPEPQAMHLGSVVALPHKLSPFEEALLLDEQGDDRAEEIYLRAIESDDYAADAWCNLGVLRSLDGDLEGAFECFAQSLGAEPKHAESHYNIGNLYFEISDLRLARTHYEMARDIDPTFPSVHFNLGLVTALSEDYEAAHESLSQYKALVPESEARVADELLGYIRTAIHLS